MIGIDIVDFTDPILKTRTSQEHRFIINTEDRSLNIADHNLQFWVLWAIKEATFKAHGNLTRFDPKEIIVHFNGKSKAVSYLNGKRFNVKYEYTEKYTMAIAYTGNRNMIYAQFGVSNDLQEQKRKVRLEAQYSLKQIGKQDALTLDHHHENLSFSHHHHLGAYAFYVD